MSLFILLFVVGCSQTMLIRPTAYKPLPIIEKKLPSKLSTATATVALAPLAFVDSSQSFGLDHSWDVALGDLDGDGDLDAFIANDNQDGKGKIYLNDGQGFFIDSKQDINPCLRVALGDLDGDLDLDAVITNWDTAKSSWFSDVSVWINEGTAHFVKGQDNLGGEEVINIALGDVDEDGDLDIFFAQIGTNAVWLNEGMGNFYNSGQQLTSGVDASVALADLDGDGDLDALAGGWEAPARAWLNDGTGTFNHSGQEITDKNIHIHDLALGDLDGDGDIDAVAAIASGHPHQVLLNDGNGLFRQSQELTAPLAHGVDLSDVDLDGDLDIITTHGTTTGGGTRIWLNDGTGSFENSRIQLGNSFSSAVSIGDLDSDGDFDMFVTSTRWNHQGDGSANKVWLNQIITSTAPIQNP